MSYDIWKYQSEQLAAGEAFRLNGYVFDQMNGAQSFIPTLLISFHKVETESDMLAYIARLETVEIAERWRMQPLGSERVRIINDAYNASPDSMSAALRTLAQITEPGQRKVAVLGAGGAYMAGLFK